MNDLSIKQNIIMAGQRLYQRNMLAAADGNISYRKDNEHIFITPAGRAKAFLQVEDLALITIDNGILHGSPSSERLMHLSIYQQCPKARCVIHAHPPTAIAWSIAHPTLQELPKTCLSELIIACGTLPIVPYARPGTQAMGDVLLPYLPKHRLLILARHGALAWGESIEEALNGLERVEHTAEILYRAELLGGLTHLPEEEIGYLENLRQKLGDTLL